MYLWTLYHYKRKAQDKSILAIDCDDQRVYMEDELIKAND